MNGKIIVSKKQPLHNQVITLKALVEIDQVRFFYEDERDGVSQGEVEVPHQMLLTFENVQELQNRTNWGANMSAELERYTDNVWIMISHQLKFSSLASVPNMRMPPVTS